MTTPASWTLTHFMPANALLNGIMHLVGTLAVTLASTSSPEQTIAQWTIILGAATVVLAASTLILAGVTYKAMRENKALIAATKLQAEAATEAAKAAECEAQAATRAADATTLQAEAATKAAEATTRQATATAQAAEAAKLQAEAAIRAADASAQQAIAAREQVQLIKAQSDELRKSELRAFLNAALRITERVRYLLESSPDARETFHMHNPELRDALREFGAFLHETFRWEHEPFYPALERMYHSHVYAVKHWPDWERATGPEDKRAAAIQDIIDDARAFADAAHDALHALTQPLSAPEAD